MNTLTKIIIVFIIGSLGFQLEAQDNFTITVNVEEASSNDGKMFIALYNAENSFLSTSYKGSKSAIKNNQCSVTFEDIPNGVYAVSIFHDENDNGKMDTNFFGIPSEDYGCSNDAKGFMGPPQWEDAKFQLRENKSITITL